MASGHSIYLAERIGRKVLQGVDFTVPASFYVAAFRDPAAATALRANNPGAANEPVGVGNYARVEVRGATGIEWVLGTNGLFESSDDIIFPNPTVDWGTTYTVALMDAASGGNVWYYGDLATPRLILSPDALRVPAGFFDVQY